MSKFVTLHGFSGNGSSGVELNFEVVGGTTEPMNPNENTIWVNTDVNVTNYDFNINEPENPVQGMVWIYIGTSSQVEFNALKENALHVYPLSAKQFVGGAWMDKTAKSYQNGEWADWSFILYNAGLKTATFTDTGAGTDHSVEWESDSVVLSVTTSAGKGDANKSINTTQDISNKNKLIVTYKDAYGDADRSTKLFAGVASGNPSITVDYEGIKISNALAKAEKVLTSGKQSGEMEVDISNITGTKTVFVALVNDSSGYSGSKSSTAKITKIAMQ